MNIRVMKILMLDFPNVFSITSFKAFLTFLIGGTAPLFNVLYYMMPI